ncbi:MAG: sugar phosphate isomerase/epimerase family protein [Chloroflexota bacterium]
MNRVGIHGMVWVGGTTAEDFETAIAGSRATGYDLIELPVFDPATMPVADIVRSLERHDLGVRCSLGLPRDKDISSADRATSARGEALLHDVISVGRDIGADFVGGVISSAMTKYMEMPSAEGRANAVAAFRRLAEQAAASGITLGLEVVNRYESNLVNTAEEALALIDEIGAPNVTVHLDSYHMNIEEDDFRTPVLVCGDRLGYVHIGENHRGYLGAGHIDFGQLFGALREVGYTGAVTFESFSSAVLEPNVSNTLGIWRNLWSDSEDLARQARRYIADQLGQPIRPDAAA